MPNKFNIKHADSTNYYECMIAERAVAKFNVDLSFENITFSADILRSLRNLDEPVRRKIIKELVGEFVYGIKVRENFTGLQNLIYYMLADKMRRYNHKLQKTN